MFKSAVGGNFLQSWVNLTIVRVTVLLGLAVNRVSHENSKKAVAMGTDLYL